jgi:hypothetical protein
VGTEISREKPLKKSCQNGLRIRNKYSIRVCVIRGDLSE